MNSEVLGSIATVTSLVFMAMGLPVQIAKNYKSKSTEGVSLFTTVTLLATTVAWTVYSIKIGNWYILISNAPGSMFAFILLCQFRVYRGSSASLSGSGFQITDLEMKELRNTGQIILSRRMDLGPPYIGKEMYLVSDSGLTTEVKVTACKPALEHKNDIMFIITLRKDE